MVGKGVERGVKEEGINESPLLNCQDAGCCSLIPLRFRDVKVRGTKDFCLCLLT